MEQVLVIAYGNLLRGDDGLAWRAADELSRALPDDVRILRTHQLTPELAEAASHAELVIFLDAAAEGAAGEVLCRPVQPGFEHTRFWHYCTPERILALCKHLYSASPRGFLVTVCGEQFEHGEALSAAAEQSIPRAARASLKLVRQEKPFKASLPLRNS